SSRSRLGDASSSVGIGGAAVGAVGAAVWAISPIRLSHRAQGGAPRNVARAHRARGNSFLSSLEGQNLVLQTVFSTAGGLMVVPVVPALTAVLSQFWGT